MAPELIVTSSARKFDDSSLKVNDISILSSLDAKPELPRLDSIETVGGVVSYTNAKFESRFKYIEKGLQDAKTLIDQATLADMEALWQEAKSKG